MKNNPKLSNDFIINIIEISAGYFSPEQMDRIFTLIETETAKYYFDSSAEANLLRIILGMFNKVSFLEDCIKYPHYVEIICAVSVNSNYLTDILVRYPEYFYWIVNPSNLRSEISGSYLEKIISKSLGTYKSFNARLNFLKSLKRKELLRIGVKDILGLGSLPGITGELSLLAKYISAHLFEICRAEILNKYGLKKLRARHCVIALGKLGGRELNYSSDIDLLVLFNKNIDVLPDKDYQDFLSEVILLFIESASAVTDSGYLYRVDFRLRPDGRNSPLCNSLESYTGYYESRGEDWERQMLIKGDFIAGDEKLYKEFFGYLSHFIYPSSFSNSPLRQIREMKNAIEKKLDDDENIKLAAGGIRNIEFCVQALQLLNGGKLPDIREANTLEAIEKLSLKKLLSQAEAKTLGEAYIFYRRVEHFLQLMNDTQTHTIPADIPKLEKLSTYMGCRSAAGFRKILNGHKKSVLRIYHSVLGEKPGKSGGIKIPEVAFINGSKSSKNLLYLREGKGLLGQKQFDKKSIAAFREIELKLYRHLLNFSNPDLVVENFVRIIRQAGFPSIWYNEFRDNKFFGHFLRVCGYSQKSVNLFAEDKQLREVFLSKKAFEPMHKEGLGVFSAKEILFRISVQFAIGKINAKRASLLLSSFCMEKIKSEFEKFIPPSKAGRYMVAALGSLGTGSMTFSSDIDLVFISDTGEDAGKDEELFRNFLSRLRNELKPFDVDCRLRPEGKSSQLVWNISAYRKYLKTRARTWEFQAFCKLNFAAGSRDLFNSLTKEIKHRLEETVAARFLPDILEMRKKLYPVDLSGIVERWDIKRSRGGIADIEFVLQFLMIGNPSAFYKLKGAGVEKSVRYLNKNLPGVKIDEVTINDYYFLKSLTFALQVLFDSAAGTITSDEKKTGLILEFMGFGTYKEFTKKLGAVKGRNESLFRKYIGGKK